MREILPIAPPHQSACDTSPETLLLPRRRILTLAAAFSLTGAVALVLHGCGGGRSTSTGTQDASGSGRATLTIAWPERAPADSRLVPVAANSITISFLSGTAVVATQTVTRPTTVSSTTVSFPTLPAGELFLRAEAFPGAAGDGVAQASALQFIRIVGGSTAALSITMFSTIYSLGVTPSTPSITVGLTADLAVTALNAREEIILTASAFRWVSSNPAVATVSDSTTATVSVTAVTLGTATIKVTELESGVSVDVPLTVTRVPDPPADTRTLVELANAYINSLSPQQRAATVLASSPMNAIRWSDLLAVPDAGTGTNALRNGVAYSTLSSEQKLAWQLLIKKVLGTLGFHSPTFPPLPVEERRTLGSELSIIRKMDRYLTQFDNTRNEDYVYIGFVGTPSETGKWLLQISGRHVAYNQTYVGNTSVSQTPYCVGAEPEIIGVTGSQIGLPEFPGESYVLFAVKDRTDAFMRFKGTLDASQRAQAKLEGTFSDLLVGPGKDARSHFPTGSANRGLLAAALRPDQKEILALLLALHTRFVTDNDLRARYNALYASEIDATYIGYSGYPGSPDNMSELGDYFRLDGPHVWIEHIVQPGSTPGLPENTPGRRPPNNMEYRSLWRDKVTDYNGEFSL